MKNKGQASFEFLTTYGWAVLMIMIMIGALAYFGVLNPSKFLPERCNFPSEFICVDYQLDGSAGDVNVDIRHNYKHSLIGVNASCEFRDGASTTSSVDADWEVKETMTVSCSSPSPGVLISGQKEKVFITLTYKLRSGGYDHYAEGEVYANVQ